jgi:hypothetical protein
LIGAAIVGHGDVMPPLSLTDHQLALIKQAAKYVSIDRRDEFLRGVASHLGAEPSDATVQAAIDTQLAVNKLPVFLCDAAMMKEKIK